MRKGSFVGARMDAVFMFPGQSSRYAGMIGKLAVMSLANRELL